MSIEERGRALEEAFYAKKNAELLGQVKLDLDTKSKRDDIKSATGITDDTVLDSLIGIGVDSSSLAAISIAPMVFVAWADGSINDKEREAVMAGAEKAGISADSTAAKMLSGWLTEKPDASLTEAWKGYIDAINLKLPAGDKVKLGEQIMARCSSVAEPAGGFLGLGSISTKEKAILDMLKSTLDA